MKEMSERNGIRYGYIIAIMDGVHCQIPAKNILDIDIDNGTIRIITDTGLEALERGPTDRPKGA